jgi:hypothetical protein
MVGRGILDGYGSGEVLSAKNTRGLRRSEEVQWQMNLPEKENIKVE